MSELRKALNKKYPELREWSDEDISEFSVSRLSNFVEEMEAEGVDLYAEDREIEEFLGLFFGVAARYLNQNSDYNNITADNFSHALYSERPILDYIIQVESPKFMRKMLTRSFKQRLLYAPEFKGWKTEDLSKFALKNAHDITSALLNERGINPTYEMIDEIFYISFIYYGMDDAQPFQDAFESGIPIPYMVKDL